MKKFLLLSLALIAAIVCRAQTFYGLEFHTPDNNHFVGLLIYSDDEHISMRLVDEEMLQKNSCYATNYTCHIEEKEDADDVGVMMFVPDDEGFPSLLWVWEKDDESDISDVPFIVYDANDADSWYKTDQFAEIALSEMNPDFVSQFYGENEPEYKRMLQGIKTVTQQNTYTSQVTPGTGGSTMHLMVVANTDVSDIGSACETDLRRIRSEFGGIAKVLGMTLNEQIIAGTNYGKRTMDQVLETLSPEDNDVVVFVYTGHGFRFKNQPDEYPCLDLSSSAYDDAEENFMALSDVFRTIVKKQARLNIVLSDCCNSEIDMNQPMVLSNSLFSRSNTNFDIEKLRVLFLQSKGEVIATAASPGEKAWCGDNGGFFLLSFFENLRSQISALNNDTPSWDTLIKNTIQSAAKKTADNKSCKTQNGLKEVRVKGL